ncbi:Transcriptional regulator (plasmid) [Paraburkholderia caribensis MBA4]|uniref:Transcriptional regulator n=1 Tax=Paraburkholderia caribensis MBA4 TaxID=1323664 RepID=A0A0P0RQL2_9BURK|nr:cupin domain-containing protein [Paraburkholderia caribensis]ALL71307.1 Transcriptional regulator [Paraburkholderia caribensis MBA4]
MKRITASIVAPALSAALIATSAAAADPSAITVVHSGSQPSVQGGTQRFTGQVRIDPLFQPKQPSRLSGGMVTFEPGARTAWHTHPLGQTLVVTSGRGWIQAWGAQRQEVAAGDVVSIPAGAKHWHGATSITGMTHIALQEALDGKNVDWLDQVTDEQYGNQ